MEETGCEVIFGATTTLAINEQMKEERRVNYKLTLNQGHRAEMFSATHFLAESICLGYHHTSALRIFCDSTFL